MAYKITSVGNYDRTTKWLMKMTSGKKPQALEQLGSMGVRALASATPKDSGETASSWYYEVERSNRGWDLIFYNSAHPETRVPVALLIQYGHGTRNGGYVQPIDYINPAMASIYAKAGDMIAKEVQQ